MMFRQRTRSICVIYRSFCSTTEASNLLIHKLQSLSRQGNVEEAVSLFLATCSSLPLHSQQPLYASLFHACARTNSLHWGQSLHCHMLTHLPTNPPDLFISNHLINMYSKCGIVDYAHQLFDDMPNRNVVSWTALISGYAQSGKPETCCRLFSDMLVECRPNEFAFASVLSSCNYEQGRQVHTLALKMAFNFSVHVANALITMYGKSFNRDGGCGNPGDEAWTVFKTMECRNLISWNSMIAGFQFCGLWEGAVGLFIEMHREGIGFERATLLSVLSSLCGSTVSDVVSGSKFCPQLHCLCIKTGFTLEIKVITALVKVYSDIERDINDCYRLFMESCFPHDIVSWTGIITACAEHDPEKALYLFCTLRREDLAPDWYTFSTVLKACASFVTERPALAVHAQVIKVGFIGDLVLANALIHAYARSGSLVLSKQVFCEMKFHDLVTWNSMIKACALHGQAEEALQLFSQMNIPPDSATFVAVLSACNHSGLVEEGKKIYETMSKSHGIIPQLDHYACMVDILARAGQLQEAWRLISTMPMKPDSVIWSSLLGACRKHGDSQLAKFAATKLNELDPENSLGYVQMSNIYCSSGSFNEAGLIREEMEGSRVRKEPGLSWVEIGNQVHEFASGGLRHPQREIICAKLEVLIGRLKQMGYVPETSLALHDIEEEHKEEQLYHHSEKLALAFATMNEGFHCGGGAIQIVKNIRICVDCHNFMKLASDLLGKEIVVRDSNRFHHFKHSICSCKDYW